MGQNRILRTVTNNRQANLTASIAMENIKKIILLPPLLDVT
jgi:hypothetical protein